VQMVVSSYQDVLVQIFCDCQQRTYCLDYPVGNVACRLVGVVMRCWMVKTAVQLDGWMGSETMQGVACGNLAVLEARGCGNMVYSSE